MKIFNIAIFALFMVVYGAISVFQFLSGAVYDQGVFASQENSFMMYMYVVLYAIVCVGLLGNIGSFMRQDGIFYLILALALYYILTTVLSTIFYGDIKYTGTGVIFSSVSYFVFLFFYMLGRQRVLPDYVYMTAFTALAVFEAICMMKLFRTSYLYSDSVVIMQFYTVFLLLPWCLCFKNRLLPVSAFLFFGVLTAYSAKRGAFVALIGVIIVYYAIKSYMKNRNIMVVMVFLPIILLVVFGMMFFFVDFSFLIERFSNLEDDRGSGRLDIYALVIDALGNSNPLSIIFGSGGFYGARDITMQIGIFGAHNDYLGLLCDVGIVGLSLVLSIIYLLVKRFLTLVKIASPLVAPMGASLFIILLLSNVSTIFLGNFTTVPFFTFLGYVIGCMNSYQGVPNPLNRRRLSM